MTRRPPVAWPSHHGLDEYETAAVFVYEAARLQADAMGAPIVPEPWQAREPAFREQFVEVIRKQVGPDRSADPESLHQDWVDAYAAMGWVYGPVRDPDATPPTHPDMVPFAGLGPREQAKDAVFVALCEIARLYVVPSPGWVPDHAK